MSRVATIHGRQNRVIALRATNASIEASVTALELVEQLIANGVARPRQAAALHVIGARVVMEGVATRPNSRRALG